jgi:large subunit ribosomal protein L29
MKIQELKELGADELRAREGELRDQLFKLKFQKTLGQLDSPMKIKALKKDIARIRTLLTELSRGTE